MNQGLDHGPVPTAALTLGRFDNPRIPAAYTYFGQFLDHDLSRIEGLLAVGDTAKPDVDQLVNRRDARLKLDHVYGDGPAGSPSLYQEDGRIVLASIPDLSGGQIPEMGIAGTGNGGYVPLIADPRNDENLLIAQLHIAFVRFCNTCLDMAARGAFGAPFLGESTFDLARRIAEWHYQWVILHDYLPRICDPAWLVWIRSNIAEVFPRGGIDRLTPVEFALGAFRFGHSQIQPSYAIAPKPENPWVDVVGLPLFVDPAFAPASPPQFSDPLTRVDLGPGPYSERYLVNWNFLIDTRTKIRPSPTPFSSLINAKICEPMLRLPTEALGRGDTFNSIAERTLQRGLQLSLPSGQAAAIAINMRCKHTALPVIDASNIWQSQEFAEFSKFDVPLWFYILREAELCGAGGQYLGPLGSTLVAGTILGALAGEPTSIMNLGRGWRPELGDVPGHFDLVDVLTVAGMRGTRNYTGSW